MLSYNIAPEQLCDQFLAHILKLKSPIKLSMNKGQRLVDFIDMVLCRVRVKSKTHIWLYALRLMEIIESRRASELGFQPPIPENPGVYFGIALMLSYKHFLLKNLYDTRFPQQLWVNIMAKSIPTFTLHESILWELRMVVILGGKLPAVHIGDLEKFQTLVHNVYLNKQSTAAFPGALTPEIQLPHAYHHPLKSISSQEEVEWHESPTVNMLADEMGRVRSAIREVDHPNPRIGEPLQMHFENSRQNTCPLSISVHSHPSVLSHRPPVQKAPSCPEPIPRFSQWLPYQRPTTPYAFHKQLSNSPEPLGVTARR